MSFFRKGGGRNGNAEKPAGGVFSLREPNKNNNININNNTNARPRRRRRHRAAAGAKSAPPPPPTSRCHTGERKQARLSFVERKSGGTRAHVTLEPQFIIYYHLKSTPRLAAAAAAAAKSCCWWFWRATACWWAAWMSCWWRICCCWGLRPWTAAAAAAAAWACSLPLAGPAEPAPSWPPSEWCDMALPASGFRTPSALASAAACCW